MKGKSGQSIGCFAIRRTKRFSCHRVSYEFKEHLGFGSVAFRGVLWKSQSGHNRNWTKISVNYHKASDKILHLNTKLSLSQKLKPKGVEKKKIYESLNEMNGQDLMLTPSTLTIELRHILESRADFDRVGELMERINVYRKIGG